MKASGGDNIIAMYDGQKVPFYVDREYAKDLSWSVARSPVPERGQQLGGLQRLEEPCGPDD